MPHLNRSIISTLRGKRLKIKTVEDLFSLRPEVRAMVLADLSKEQLEDVEKFGDVFPFLQVDHEVKVGEEDEVTSNSLVTLVVTLIRTWSASLSCVRVAGSGEACQDPTFQATAFFVLFCNQNMKGNIIPIDPDAWVCGRVWVAPRKFIHSKIVKQSVSEGLQLIRLAPTCPEISCNRVVFFGISVKEFLSASGFAPQDIVSSLDRWHLEEVSDTRVVVPLCLRNCGVTHVA